eukprot:CAMPEP_0117515662 /NCGR_PEP_ID=MMETSP0784-20121206/30695_1 /TAXON_ID=39447 /ORGANISM="" /LENGTH=520 /DNA_ID=CAMNT_0005311485 /DNA_START=63 /DNA_END=1621 /DNA_ORIENTATION=+
MAVTGSPDLDAALLGNEHPPAELRVDPNNERAYTLEDTMKYLGNKMTEKEIIDFWEHECVPTGLPLLPGAIPLWKHNEAVPAWAYNSKTAAGVADSEWKNGKTFFALTAIEAVMVPAWRYALCAVAMVWSFWAIIPFVALRFSTCAGVGIAAVPPWLLSCYFPVLGCSIALEMKCHSIVLPALCRHVPTGDVMGVKTSFRVWYAARLLMSASAHMDLATNGIFLGRLLGSSSCDASRLDAVWQDALSNSAMNSFSWVVPSLATIGLVTWIFMGAQLFVGLLYSIPCRTRHVRAEQEHKTAHQFTMSSFAELLCSSSPQENSRLATAMGVLNPCDAVLSLAQVGRMGLLNGRRSSICRSERGPRLSKSAETRKNWALGIQKDAFLTSFSLLMESTVMANLQATALGVVKVAGGGIDTLTFVSILLTLGVLMMSWMLAAQVFVQMVRLWKRNFGKHLNRVYRDPRLHEEHLAFDEEGKRAVSRAVLVFVAACIGSCVLSAYAVAQVIMDVFVCDVDGVWFFG